jgi:hypothetical protein
LVGVGDDVRLGAIRTIGHEQPSADVLPAAEVAPGTVLAVWQAGVGVAGDILGQYVTWPDDDPDHVVVEGRVLAAGGTASRADGSFALRVDRVRRGIFDCAEARVDYGAASKLPSALAIGDRLAVDGRVAPGGSPCVLDAAAPGASILPLPPFRSMFVPLVLRRR